MYVSVGPATGLQTRDLVSGSADRPPVDDRRASRCLRERARVLSVNSNLAYLDKLPRSQRPGTVHGSVIRKEGPG